ncbi:MAG: HAMP domain-containing histidine kinase [Gemmatimonadaceae bacterium]|nr:HAMP domain-containing histidine kinase [Gemmatimonadaceae bacterium]NUQ91478.1 HAMP domain-containing histidine kinase [Gemmatimonadaceae bacterium]NUR20316.1 HAMP domain-containing histidine kinase [Gemmatimonadaceae bacterium]NUS98420.1 HAMP domain-containing histidine kinase [Gemmatimonadaceae bacterium]
MRGQLDDALQLAFARARAACAHAAPDDELDLFFATLREAVDAALANTTPRRALPRSLATERIIERVRLEFIVAVHAVAREHASEALDVLAALGTIQQSPVGEEGERLNEGYLASDRVAVELTTEIAHDVRSPLTAILFLVDTLRSGRSGPIAPAQARQLGIIYGAAFGLNQLATDIIDHVNGERLVESAPVSFSIAELLYSVRDILAPMTEERQLEMRLSSVQDDGRLGFPAPLHRVLLNLAANALKYTARGSVSISARQLDGTRVAFTVADTGPGIPRRVQARLFQAFRPGERDDRRLFSSSGLGLTICRDLVARLGGELRVTSTAGKGTKFSFELDLPLAGSPA